ncbi:hypothetical protein CL633_01265 [bacterium]|nr:hypothetical protein [bacterium]|tara:strand:- start:4672 stop:6144 length:1473 start_codon:yes stop_codon:yes gene_type:complete
MIKKINQKTNKYFSYVRVSSKKQSEGGSLSAQEKAIKSYAKRNDLNIIKQFKDIQSARKSGQRINFKKMIKELEQRQDMAGIIIHKIDRGARNLYDWAYLGKLHENGIDIKFAHENLDLHSRSGRLTADILAAIAADYLRNLSEEVKKGMYEKLEQGFYPYGAPTGYLNTGAGEIKEIDPLQGNLVRQAFDLYLTKEFSLIELTRIMKSHGLKTTRGHSINKNCMSKLLNNRFYIGLMDVKGQTYKGNHTPLITMQTFTKVQKILHQRTHKKVFTHYYLFKGMLTCGYCGSRLRAMFAKKKYHYYYCKNKDCEMKCTNEKKVESWIKQYLKQIAFKEQEAEMFKKAIKESRKDLFKDSKDQRNILIAEKTKLENRSEKLLDLYIDQKIEESEYKKKKSKLLVNIRKLEDKINAFSRTSTKTFTQIEKLGKLLEKPLSSYISADLAQKRCLIKSMIGKLYLKQEKLDLEWLSPFDIVAKRTKFAFGGVEGI